MICLDVIANLASILTAVVAAGAAIHYWCDARSKQKRLERYLCAEHDKNPQKCTHTMVHLMAELGMTEAEILRASFASNSITHKIRTDQDTGLAAQLLFAHTSIKGK